MKDIDLTKQTEQIANEYKLKVKIMYTIKKEFHFSASHTLHGLPKGHKCGRDHGHNYIIIVELSAYDLDGDGFVEDYGRLKDVKEYIDDVLDHRNLNMILPFQTSAENIARHIYDMFSKVHPALCAVHVKETPKTIATYRCE